jgi:hypothetical protein
MSCFEADRVFSHAPSPNITELRRHLKQRLKTSPILRSHLSNLEQMLKSWNTGGNRENLAGNIERTIRAIEKLRQPNGERDAN